MMNRPANLKPVFYFDVFAASSNLSPVALEDGFEYDYNTLWTSGAKVKMTIRPGTTPHDIQELFPTYPGLQVIRNIQDKDDISESRWEILAEDTDLGELLDSGYGFRLHHPDVAFDERIYKLPSVIQKKAQNIYGFDGRTLNELEIQLNKLGINWDEFISEFQQK